jgi:hypothetical protein
MKQLFKSTLLAAAVAATCGTAFAGNVAVTKQVHSTEGLVGVTANQTSNSISYVLKAAYKEGDKITFAFPDGALVATTFPTVINLPPVNNADEAKAIAGLTLGLLNSDTKSVTYRVTKLTLPHNGGSPSVEWQNGSTIDANLVLGSVGYKASALSSPVTVTVSSQTTAGDVLDASGTRTATIAEAKSQFGTVKVGTKFDNTIDVGQMRKAFVGTSSDAMRWDITNPNTAGWLNMATVNASNGTVVTLNGEPGKMTGLVAGNWTSAGTRTFTAAESKLVMSHGGMVTNDTITFTPTTGTKAVVLETQKFSSKFDYNYTSAGAQAGSKTIGANVDSGEWKLNGATVNIPYMPYGPSASQIMYISNAGDQAGDISVTVFDDKGNYHDLGVVGKAGAKRITKVAPLINSKLQEKGFNGTKASITITVNAPAADITVYASYNIGSADRGFVNTDQYKGKE